MTGPLFRRCQLAAWGKAIALKNRGYEQIDLSATVFSDVHIFACMLTTGKHYGRPHVRSFPALLLFHFRLDSVSSPLEFVHLDAVQRLTV